ncbi:hypothetical protein HON22_01540, partial [Candidatus Peregrinibacteria bacterium]|nr:hypothetical protein [Candidatus Peregrinibacteria bacterium]
MKKFITTFLGFFFFSLLLSGAIGVLSVHAASKTCGPNNYTDASGVTKGTNAAICISLKCSAEEIEDLVPGCFSDGFVAPDSNQVSDKINEESFRAQVLKIVNYFLTFLGLLAVVAIVYAGIIMVADFGNEEMVGKAKNILLWSSLGMIIVLLSFSFVNFILDIGEDQPVQCFETSISTSPVNCNVCGDGWVTEKGVQGQTKRVCKEGATNSSSIAMCENGTVPCYACENGWNILTKNCLAANVSADAVQCFEGGQPRQCIDCQYGGWNEATRQCFDASVVSAQSPLKCNDGNGTSIACFQCPNGWDIKSNTCLALKPFGAPICLEADGSQSACSSCLNGGFNTATRQCFDSAVLSDTPTQCKDNGVDTACYLCPSGGWNTVTNECIQTTSVPISSNPLNSSSSINILDNIGGVLDNIGKINNETSGILNRIQNTSGALPQLISRIPSRDNQKKLESILNASGLSELERRDLQNALLQNQRSDLLDNFRSAVNKASRGELSPAETTALKNQLATASPAALNQLINDTNLSSGERTELVNALKKILTPHNLLQKLRSGQIQGDDLENIRKQLNRNAQQAFDRTRASQAANLQGIRGQLDSNGQKALDKILSNQSSNPAVDLTNIRKQLSLNTRQALDGILASEAANKGENLEDIRKQLNRDAQKALDKTLANQSLTDKEERDLIEALNRITGLPSPDLLAKAFNRSLLPNEQQELERYLKQKSKEIVERLSEDNNLNDEERAELEKAVTQALVSDPKNIDNKLVESALSGKLPQTEVDRLLRRLSPEAGTLLNKSHSPRLVNAAERKLIEDVLNQYFTPAEVSDALYAIDTGRQVPEEEEEVIKEALNAQGIDRQV